MNSLTRLHSASGTASICMRCLWTHRLVQYSLLVGRKKPLQVVDEHQPIIELHDAADMLEFPCDVRRLRHGRCGVLEYPLRGVDDQHPGAPCRMSDQEMVCRIDSPLRQAESASNVEHGKHAALHIDRSKHDAGCPRHRGDVHGPHDTVDCGQG